MLLDLKEEVLNDPESTDAAKAAVKDAPASLSRVSVRWLTEPGWIDKGDQQETDDDKRKQAAANYKMAPPAYYK